MDKILARIGEIGLVPVIKIESADNAVDLGKALIAGGIPVAEVTFRTGAAAEAIRRLSDALPDLLVGAGTVTSVRQAEEAVSAGARFLVSPGWDEAVVDYCLDRKLPILPGVSGPDGVLRGMAKGLEVLKFFPASASGGIPMIDALAGPFPSIQFVPTGGIDAGNVGSWAQRPNVLALGGSWMVKTDLVESRNWASVERLCREAVLALHGFAFAHVGLNGADVADCRAMVDRMSSLFGLAGKEGSSSFMLEGLELTKKPFPGAKGHLAIRCNDVERALARFRDLGVGSLPDTAKKERGKLKAIYLDLEIGGFAVHLLRA